MRACTLCFILIWLMVLLFGCKPKDQQPESVNISLQPGDFYTDSTMARTYIGEADGSLSIRSRSVAYDYLHYDVLQEKDLLLQITTDQVFLPGEEFADGQLRIVANEIGSNAVQTNLYSTTLPGTSYQLDGGMLVAKHQTTFEGEPTYHAMNAFTGEHLFSYTNDLLGVVIPNSKERRYLGFVSRSAAGDYLMQKHEGQLVIGEVTYASNTQVIDRFLLLVDEEKLLDSVQTYTPDLTIFPEREADKLVRDNKDIILWDADADYIAADIDSFEARFTLWYGHNYIYHTLRVPITEDRIDYGELYHRSDVFDIKVLIEP